MSEVFYTVVLRAVPQKQVDIISAEAFEYGCQGVEEPLEFFQEYDNYEPQLVPKSTTQILLYFADTPDSAFLDWLESDGGLEFTVVKELNRDWLEEWKKGFHSFELVDGVWVVPSWEDGPSEAQVQLSIDPGMAFGTGTHETTQVVSQLMAEQGEWPQSAMDVGTGTGILAMYLKAMKVPLVRATEIEPVAREVAQKNCQLNRLGVEVVEHQIQHDEGQYEWVVANIIDGVLTDLKAELIRSCTKKMFLSGIVHERREIFEQRFLPDNPFRITQSRQLGEWWGLVLERA